MESLHNLSPPYDPPDWGNPENLDPEKVRKRIKALNRGANFFFHDCANCGRETAHDFKFAECTECFPALRHSILRPGENLRRIMARRNRASCYISECPECGPDTPHHVRNGKCATCFTSQGGHRRAERAFPPARREAELAKRRRYWHDCMLHGRTEHHTRRGLCLECFDTQGKPRGVIYMGFCRDCEDLTVHEIVTRSCTICDPMAADNLNRLATSSP